MKRIVSFILAMLFFIISGCTDYKNAQNDKFKIVTTIFPLYDFARNIAGDCAEIEMIVPMANEVHSFEPTTKDVIKINESDLFINIGMGLDPWTDKLETKGKVLSVSQCLDFDEETHAHSIDEHIWTSLENARDIADAICKELTRLDPENAHKYKQNYEKYSEKLEGLDDKFEQMVNSSKRRTIVFADSFPFYYLAKDYGLNVYSAFPGCSSETEPSVRDISTVIEIIKEQNIPIVLYTETSNGKVPDIIVEETNAKKMMMHSAHSLSKEEMKENKTYLDIMNENLEVLYKALND